MGPPSRLHYHVNMYQKAPKRSKDWLEDVIGTRVIKMIIMIRVQD